MPRKIQTQISHVMDLARPRNRAPLRSRPVRRGAPLPPLRGEALRMGRGRRGRDPEPMLAEEELEAPFLPDETAAADPALSGRDPAEALESHEPAEPSGEPAELSANFLAVYFKEMAQLAVLKPAEEYEIAKRIGALELELWMKLLTFAPLCHYLLRVVERSLDNSLPEFRTLQKAAQRTRSRRQVSDEGLVQAAAPVAEKLRKLDIDRIHVSVLLAELEKIGTGAAGRVIDEPVPVNAKGRTFRKYVQEVLLTVRRVQRAKNDFVKANLRLVVSIARRFNHGRMPLADLIQEGNIGLIKAVERFDYRRGYRFSTYASWWIRHAISRGLADKGRAVRLPVHMIDVYHRVAKSKRELSGKLGRPPTNEEIGEATGLALGKIEKMRGYLLDQSFSLDRAVSDTDGRRFIDFIQDDSPAGHPAELLLSAMASAEVRRLLEELRPIEADILRQRFGLDTDKELTLKEIGEKYNLSRERIRQLQEQALCKMRRALMQRHSA